MKEDCIFCKISNGVIPSATIFEDEDFKVILDASPATKGHALIIPKGHFDNIFDLDTDTASKLFVIAAHVAKKMKEVLQCDGMNVLQNNGAIAGQTVYHFHMHLIPRYKNDSVNLDWKHLEFTQEEMNEVALRIQKK